MLGSREQGPGRGHSWDQGLEKSLSRHRGQVGKGREGQAKESGENPGSPREHKRIWS